MHFHLSFCYTNEKIKTCVAQGKNPKEIFYCLRLFNQSCLYVMCRELFIHLEISSRNQEKNKK